MPDCGINPTCYLGDAAESALTDAIQNMADAVLEAFGKSMASLGTLWVDLGTPNLTTSPGGSTPSDAVAFIQGSLWWYMAGAAVLAVIVGGARMAWEQRAEPGREVLKGLLTLTVVSGAGLTAIALLVTAADEFSMWIIDRSTTGTDFGQNIVNMVGLTSTTGTALGPLIVIILGLVAVIASFVQIALMVVRGGMLVILAGIFPLSASFTSTETGRAWFRKSLAWLFAFILYKPAAAIVYATAFRLTGSDVFGDDGLANVVTGVVLMLLALVALPALMRFVTPMVAATAGGASGAAAGAIAGSMAAMPTGALPFGGRGGSPSTPGPGPSSSGSGGPDGAGGAPGSKVPAGGGPVTAPTGGTAGGTAGTAAGGSAGGAAATSAGGAGAAGAGVAAAAGPVGIGVAALATGADVARKTGQAAAGAANRAAQDSTSGGGPSGSG